MPVYLNLPIFKKVDLFTLHERWNYLKTVTAKLPLWRHVLRAEPNPLNPGWQEN